jgi:hypothetical protein
MPRLNNPNMEQTAFGWAVSSDTPPDPSDSWLWLKIPERHLYMLEGNGWHRIDPPEKQFIPLEDLPHG